MLVFAAMALFMLIYLLCVCAKGRDGVCKTIWVDNIWLEFHFCEAFSVCFGAVVLVACMLDWNINGRFPCDLLKISSCSASFVAACAFLNFALSVTRNIKCKNLLGTSAILKILRACIKIIAAVFKYCFAKFRKLKKSASEFAVTKTTVVYIALISVYTFAIFMCGVYVFDTGFAVIAGVFLFLAAVFVLGWRANDLNKIKTGVREVKSGNVSYKINDVKCDYFKILANDINDIAKGLDESVSAKLRAEKMKTELITNVSHALKTPITSVINYAELLSGMKNLPQEAKDYVKIISKKSERLKNLTADLFDIAKVQSGNENVVLEKLDVSLLVNQALAEYDSEIKSSSLPFLLEVEKDMYIEADGRKMSRVVGNLISNILKYSLKNTRAFITAREDDGEIALEFKNISAYPLEFNPVEIVSRFVRGDEARSTEGIGLGLAIAKSYTELSGGKFKVVTDGDLFKAVIKFKRI